jgi:hypothetical protein
MLFNTLLIFLSHNIHKQEAGVELVFVIKVNFSKDELLIEFRMQRFLVIAPWYRHGT